MCRKVSTTCAQTYVSSDSHAHSALGWSGKLPSECVLRGHEEREGNDTPGRRDSISTLRHKERARLCGFRGEEGSLDRNEPRSLALSSGPWTAIKGCKGTLHRGARQKSIAGIQVYGDKTLNKNSSRGHREAGLFYSLL